MVLDWVLPIQSALFPGFSRLDSTPLCHHFGFYYACPQVCCVTWFILLMCLPPPVPYWLLLHMCLAKEFPLLFFFPCQESQLMTTSHIFLPTLEIKTPQWRTQLCPGEPVNAVAS